MNERSPQKNGAGTTQGYGLHCLRGDISGGLSAGITALPVAISCGVIAFAPMGPGLVAYGALAGLNTAIFVTLVAAVFGGSPLQVSGPKSSLAVNLGAVMAGLFQVLFGLLRFGNLIKFILHPVTAGFMNGLAIIIMSTQLPLFIDVAGFDLDTFFNEHITLRPKALLICAVTVGAMWLARMWLRRGGDAILALAVGTGAYYLLARVQGTENMGGVIGPIVRNIPYPNQLFNFADALKDPNIDLLAAGVVGPALVIALLGSIEPLLSATAMDAHRHVRHNSNRELIGQGLSNAVAGLFGGLAGGGSPTRSVANFDAGGRTRAASLAGPIGEERLSYYEADDKNQPDDYCDPGLRGRGDEFSQLLQIPIDVA